MKTKISVDVHLDDSLNLTFIDLIAKNNCGKIVMDKTLVIAIVTLEKIKYPNTNKYLEVINYDDDNFLSVTNTSDGLPFITLTWKEIHELKEESKEADLSTVLS